MAARLYAPPSVVVMLFFAIISWVVLIGGMTATSNWCVNNVYPRYESSDLYCARIYQLDWWSVWFEFFVVLLMLAMAYSAAFERGKFIFLSMLVLVTCLLTLTARNFLSSSVVTMTEEYHKHDHTFTITNHKHSAGSTVAAGAIMLCTVNYALIFSMGFAAATTPPVEIPMASL